MRAAFLTAFALAFALSGCAVPALRIVPDDVTEPDDAPALDAPELDAPELDAFDAALPDATLPDAPEVDVPDARPVVRITTPTPSCPVGDEPGCPRVLVDFGVGRMGSERGRDATPVQGPMLIDSFGLDAYEVTVARFRRFVAAYGADDPALRSLVARYPDAARTDVRIDRAALQVTPGEGLNCNYTQAVGSSLEEQHPVNCVDWITAQGFCAWTGGRLPTEAEYEYTARFWRAPSLAGRLYPWGGDDEPPSCQRAHTALTFGALCTGQDGRRTRRVGATPAGAVFGVHDLVGNVAEWLGDAYELYSAPGNPGHCWGYVSARNPYCPGPLTSERAFRGGSWQTTNTERDNLRPESRPSAAASLRYPMRGFRCAYAPPP